GVLGQHAFNSDLNDTLRSTLVQLLEVDALETTRETGVAVVHLVLSLVTSDLNLLGIHDHDVVTGINVRSVLRLVLATQAAGNFGSRATKVKTGGIYSVPSPFNGSRFGAEVFIKI